MQCTRCQYGVTVPQLSGPELDRYYPPEYFDFWGYSGRPGENHLQRLLARFRGWSATRSFQLDTSVPVVTAGAPADGAWVHTLQLSATFSKPAFAGTGSVDFRICSDALGLLTFMAGLVVALSVLPLLQ